MNAGAGADNRKAPAEDGRAGEEPAMVDLSIQAERTETRVESLAMVSQVGKALLSGAQKITHGSSFWHWQTETRHGEAAEEVAMEDQSLQIGTPEMTSEEVDKSLELMMKAPEIFSTPRRSAKNKGKERQLTVAEHRECLETLVLNESYYGKKLRARGLDHSDVGAMLSIPNLANKARCLPKESEWWKVGFDGLLKQALGLEEDVAKADGKEVKLVLELENSLNDDGWAITWEAPPAASLGIFNELLRGVHLPEKLRTNMDLGGIITPSQLAAEVLLDACELSRVPCFRQYSKQLNDLEELGVLLDGGGGALLRPFNLVFALGVINEDALLGAGAGIRRVVVLPAPSLELVVELSDPQAASAFCDMLASSECLSWRSGICLPHAFRHAKVEEHEDGSRRRRSSSSSSRSAVRDHNSSALRRIYGPAISIGKFDVYYCRSQKEVKKTGDHQVQSEAETEKSGSPEFQLQEPAALPGLQSLNPLSVLVGEQSTAEPMIHKHSGDKAKRPAGGGDPGDPPVKKKQRRNSAAFYTSLEPTKYSIAEELAAENRKRYIGHFPGVAVHQVFESRASLLAACHGNLHKRSQAGIAYLPAKLNVWGVPVAESVVVKHSGVYLNSGGGGGGGEHECIIYSGSGSMPIKDGSGTLITPDQLLTGGNLALAQSCVLDLPVRVMREFGSGPALRYEGLYTVTRYWQEKNPTVYWFGLERCVEDPPSIAFWRR